ncbi:MAG: GIY-YIG nuclease family protein [Nitrospirota bacterium]|nr:GIY-YIG nuclease family protein [Nitrospirota bacterium]
MKQTYRLFIRLEHPQRIRVGRLGTFDFAAGLYVYTGSARGGIGSRVLRHMGLSARPRRVRWHIDYLLTAPGCRVERVDLHEGIECAINRAGGGSSPVPGFGASDCTAGCGSHLRFLGP